MASTSRKRVDFHLHLAIYSSTTNGLIEEHPHRLIDNEKHFSCSTTVFRFYALKCCKLFCGAAQLMGVLFKSPSAAVLQCSRDVLAYKSFSPHVHLVQTPMTVTILILFSVKMSIPTNLNITITVYDYYHCFFFTSCSSSVLVLDLCFLGFALHFIRIFFPLFLW